MSEKKLTVALVVVGLVAVTAFVVLGTGIGALADDTDSAGGEGDEFVKVTASGSAEADADTVEITFAVEARDEDPSVARREVAAGAEGMRNALTAVGVAEDDVRSVGYTLRETRPFERRDGEQPTHQARHTFRVTFDDTDRAGEIIDAGVEGGATAVSGVSFTLSDARHAELKNDALETAMGNARMQADSVARAGGISVTRVRSVTTADTRFSPVGVERAQLEAADEAGTVISPGPVEVDATVEVVYDISS